LKYPIELSYSKVRFKTLIYILTLSRSSAACSKDPIPPNADPITIPTLKNEFLKILKKKFIY